MPRPCTCDKSACPLCQRFHNDPRYHALWSGLPVPPRADRDGPIPVPRPPPLRRVPCTHEGAVLEFSACGREALAVRDCDLYDRCIRGPVRPGTVRPGVRVCAACKDYQPGEREGGTVMKWSYGVTTVRQRRDDLLPRTLSSLKAAGFDRPHLFVDGCDDSRSWHDEFGLDVTARGGPNVRTAGNWVLSLYELLYRDPSADYYAVFQDDFVTSLNLRRYLEENPCPQPGYMNLYTFPENQQYTPKTEAGGTADGWFKVRVISRGKVGDREVEFQTGRGAVALVFTRDGVIDLLGSRDLSGRPLDPTRGHRAIDGGVVHCMNKAGYSEYYHSPSLVQHTGDVSAMGNRRHPQAESFRGEDFDLLTLLRPAT